MELKDRGSEGESGSIAGSDLVTAQSFVPVIPATEEADADPREGEGQIPLQTSACNSLACPLCHRTQFGSAQGPSGCDLWETGCLWTTWQEGLWGSNRAEIWKSSTSFLKPSQTQACLVCSRAHAALLSFLSLKGSQKARSVPWTSGAAASLGSAASCSAGLPCTSGVQCEPSKYTVALQELLT